MEVFTSIVNLGPFVLFKSSTTCKTLLSDISLHLFVDVKVSTTLENICFLCLVYCIGNILNYASKKKGQFRQKKLFFLLNINKT